MVDQVSLTAIGGLSASRNKSTCCLKNERDQIDVWVPVKFGLPALLAIRPGFVLAAETRDGLSEKGATKETFKMRH